MSNNKPIGNPVRDFNPGVTIKPFNNSKIVDLKDILVERGDNVTHGDVIIYKADESDLPPNFSELEDAPRGLLALGEHTGHAHAIMLDTLESDVFAADAVNQRAKFKVIDGEKDLRKFALKVTPSGDMFLRVETGTYLLKHQEHFAFRIHPGVYEIGIQQEVDMFTKELKRIVD